MTENYTKICDYVYRCEEGDSGYVFSTFISNCTEDDLGYYDYYTTYITDSLTDCDTSKLTIYGSDTGSCKNIENPTDAQIKAILAGKPLYNQNGQVCPKFTGCSDNEYFNTDINECVPRTTSCQVWEKKEQTGDACTSKCLDNEYYDISSKKCAVRNKTNSCEDWEENINKTKDECTSKCPDEQYFDSNSDSCVDRKSCDIWKENVSKTKDECTPKCYGHEYFDTSKKECVDRKKTCEVWEENVNMTSDDCTPKCLKNKYFDITLERCVARTESCQVWEHSINETRDECTPRCSSDKYFDIETSTCAVRTATCNAWENVKNTDDGCDDDISAPWDGFMLNITPNKTICFCNNIVDGHSLVKTDYCRSFENNGDSYFQYYKNETVTAS